MRSKRISRPQKSSGHAAPKPTDDQLLAIRSRFNRVGADFLKVDLDTALTFAAIASESRDPEKKQRNRRSARKAYDTVVRLRAKMDLSGSDARIIAAGLERLRWELAQLGETF